MLPVVSHEVKTRRWPYVTVCLIGLNVIAFGFEASVGIRFVPFLQEWGVVPGRIQAEITAHNLFTVGSSMFLHVGFVHLLGNMWFKSPHRRCRLASADIGSLQVEDQASRRSSSAPVGSFRGGRRKTGVQMEYDEGGDDDSVANVENDRR